MRILLLLLLAFAASHADASWYTDCLLTGKVVSEVEQIEPDEHGKKQFAFGFRVSKSVALEGTYESTDCSALESMQVRVEVPKRLFQSHPRAGGEYQIRYVMYENVCPRGGACRFERYEILTKRKAASLPHSSS